ncbi:MAG TPA: sugar transferase [Thermomicrobiales bacterium]|nr:sugar transferase [Thermomicrobiales bacterium]
MSAERQDSWHYSHPVALNGDGVAAHARNSTTPGDPLLGLAALNARSRARVMRAQRRVYSRGVKRLVDVVFGSVLFALCFPVLALAYIAILLESGRPVMFMQKRVGRDGVLFEVMKFRTMIPDRRSHSLDITFRDRRVRHKSSSDPRVTRVGAFLRRTSIDELPQLLNVVRGEMSLVGPRPELPGLVERYEDWQHARHLVRPGITGWWQINGRSDLPMHLSTDLDIFYLEHMSFWLDVRILLQTPASVVNGHGAY